jgi:hypothetical protein
MLDMCGDAGEPDLTGEEGGDRNLVGGIEHRGRFPA